MATMRKRILLRLALLAIVTIAGFGLLVWSMPQRRIDHKTFGKVCNGMSKAEIHAILNCPPGDYCSRAPRFAIPTQIPIGDLQAEATEQWTSDTAAIRIWYDADDRVVLGMFQGTGDAPLSLLEKLRRWLVQRPGL